MTPALISLRLVLSLIAMGWLVADTFPSEAALTLPIVTCEQPTNSTAVQPPKSESDIVLMMKKWMAHQEAISQMETWWRERSKPDASASEPVPPGTKEAISQMKKWWQQRTELKPTTGAKPHRPHRRQRHYAVSGNEFGCPPSVCSKPLSVEPNATPSQQQYQQAVQQYRQAEELYQRQGAPNKDYSWK
jgi:hypothetical protein